MREKSMAKGRMNKKDGKFIIDRKGSLEANIKQIEAELDIISKGAPKIYESEEDIKKDAQKTAEEIPEQQPVSPDNTIYHPPANQFYYRYHTPDRPVTKTPLLKNSKFYITVFAIAAFGFTLIKAPVFNYTTPFRPDHELPNIEVAFKYYNNIFGKQTRQVTLIKIGEKTVLTPISMEQWVNLDINKKQLVLKEYFYK